MYIKVTDENSFRLEDAIALASRTKGNSRILVYFEKDKKLRQAKDRSALITERLLRQLKEIMGEENIAVK